MSKRPRSDAEVLAVLLARSVRRGDCRIWTGVVDGFGYGQISYKGKRSASHRVMYELTNGPIPKGYDVCHSCDTPACIEPSHLWAGDRSANMVDCVQKVRHASARKTHCSHGHEFTPENTRLRPDGRRVCIQCERERAKRDWELYRGDFPPRTLKTHCKHGHPLSGDNVYVPPGDPTRRKCKACHYINRNIRFGKLSSFRESGAQ
jgi:HNH endonuclease